MESPAESRQSRKNDKRRGVENLREGLALGPDGVVVADDGSGGETIAFDVAQEMIIYVRLP